MDKPELPDLSRAEIGSFESALAESDPVPLLRKFAKDLSAQGMKRREIYLKFLAYSVRLQSAGRENEENILGDVMDMIMDAFSPFNLNLPK